jgi:hypothetical protein
MKRRSFLAGALIAPWAALAAASAWLQSCGGYDAMLATACDGRTPVIGMTNGHTHPACVPMSALNAGTAYTMTLEATAYANHSHTFALTSTDMATLKAGGSLPASPSSSAGVPSHSHSVTF